MSNRDTEVQRVAPGETVLYPLPPKGVGTAGCESILSYVARLADAHRVSLQNLYLYIEQHSLDTWSRTGRANPVEGLALKAPNGFIETVARLTGQTSVRHCSFESVSELVNVQTSGSRRKQRYCAECVRQAPYPHAWNRLLWAVDAVEACPEHGILLSDSTCNAPREEWVYVSDHTFLPGVCKSCRKIAFACNHNGCVRASRQQIWVAQQVGEFIAALSGGTVIDAEELRTGIKLIIRERWTYIKDAAQSLGLSRYTIFDATALRAPVSLKLLLSLCSAVDARLMDLLRGRPLTVAQTCEPIVYPAHIRFRVLPIDNTQFCHAANRFMSLEPDITLTELANRLGVCPSTLYRRLPDIVQQLRSTRRARAAYRRWRRHLRFARKLHYAKLQIEADGLPFNTGTIYDYYKIILRSDANVRLFCFVRDSL